MQSGVVRTCVGASIGLLMAAVVSGASQKQQWLGDGPEHGTPCAAGLVVIETDPGCPLEIEILEARCREAPHTIWARYALTNVGAKQIQGYVLRTSERYERHRNENKGYGAERLELGPGSRVENWATCCDKVGSEVSDAGSFTALVLRVSEVTFADGTVWRRPGGKRSPRGVAEPAVAPDAAQTDLICCRPTPLRRAAEPER